MDTRSGHCIYTHSADPWRWKERKETQQQSPMDCVCSPPIRVPYQPQCEKAFYSSPSAEGAVVVSEVSSGMEISLGMTPGLNKNSSAVRGPSRSKKHF